MIKTKILPQGSENLIKEIAAKCGVSQAFSKLLVSRGIKSAEEAEKFINPDKRNLYDPFLFGQMKNAVSRITKAKENGETVVVYGDYDADGISATTILYKGLKLFGVEAVAVVPERENGYGLTEGVLERVLEEYCPDLLITVDCGISAVNEVAELEDLGVDVIVTDHHEIPEKIPDCTIINCKLHDGYPFDGLCGAGVAYKLVKALIGDEADNFLDLVAVATVADSMPLTDENRILVSEGLKLIKSGRCSKAVRAIAEIGGLKEITSTSLAYTIAPRLNAAGRMGDAYSALVAFTSEDNYEIKLLADKLNTYNIARQAECDELYKSAKEKMKTKSPLSRVIILFDEKWRSGLIGIAAAKLVEEYTKPAILFVEKDGVLHGSARSLAGINIFKALSAVSDVIEQFGGHSQAAGVTIKKENIDIFEKKLNDYLCENYGIEVFSEDIEVDGIVTGKFGMSLAKELELLEPCGVENRRPIFALSVAEAYASPIKYGSPHVSFSTPQIDMMFFGGYDFLPTLNSSSEKTVVFEPRISVFNGRENLKGYVKEVIPVVGDNDDVKLALFENQLKAGECQSDFETIDRKTAQNFIDEAKSEIYGTLLVVNDPETVFKYGGLDGMETDLMAVPRGGNKNKLCYGLSEGDFGEYLRVVFLDKPLFVPRVGTKAYVVSEIEGFSGDGIKTDRDTMINAYLALKKIEVGFTSVKDACLKLNENNRKQIAFAIKVFEELGLISFKNGRYYVVGGKKCDLNSSVIFCRATCS